MSTHFKSPWWLKNPHLQTVYPSLFRKIPVQYEPERIELKDGDFLDLDWAKKGNKKLVIVTHGLEGDASRHYVTGIIKILENEGFDGLGWNCRSCGGEMNRLPRFYHHGDAGDLKAVVEYACTKDYAEIYLVGFSMGGSLTIRFLAENKTTLDAKIKKAVVASVPLDLTASVKELNKPGKRFYQKRFLKKLAVKIEIKSKTYPENALLGFDDYWTRIKNFEDFDNTYTAPLHGFENALDFYAKASAKPLLKDISIPLHIIQAQNDPFLTPECYEIDAFKNNPHVKMLKTDEGGHVGFLQAGKKYTFVEEYVKGFFK